jgi:hypothetical protein
MASRIDFSGEHLTLYQVGTQYRDVDRSLRLYFSDKSPDFSVRFTGYLSIEVTRELAERLNEADLNSSLAILGAIEAAFRIDYLQRCYKRTRDPLSRAFRDIYKEKRQRAALEDDIFESWLNNSDVPGRIIGELRGAFKFRHWLAHGRYWIPKLGRKYDFNAIFTLAELVFQSFPFFGVD